jgi:hypothetical protein
MANVLTAKLFVTQSDADTIEFRVVYSAEFTPEELGHTFNEFFNLFERDTTSADDVIASGLASANFAPDTTRVTRTLTATLSEGRVATEVGNEEIFARVILSGPPGLAVGGRRSLQTNEVQVAA